jgi:hypothetical protein
VAGDGVLAVGVASQRTCSVEQERRTAGVDADAGAEALAETFKDVVQVGNRAVVWHLLSIFVAGR